MEAVTSLELGADDYVRLPCDLTELTTRIWALMRRAGTTATYETENPLTSGHLMVNPATYEAFLSGRRLALTTTEFRMLFPLIKNWGIVVSRQTLERTLWGERVDSYGLVKKYVQRLRQKLGDDAASLSESPMYTALATASSVPLPRVRKPPPTIRASRDHRSGALNLFAALLFYRHVVSLPSFWKARWKAHKRNDLN